MAILFFAGGPAGSAMNQTQPVRQTADVIEAYKLSETFEHIIGENLDFGQAFEATFPRGKQLRRAIAADALSIPGLKLDRVDGDLLIRAFKARGAIYYMVFPLMYPDGAAEQAEFFPTAIFDAFKRKPSLDWRDFPSFVHESEYDVAAFRIHLKGLSANSKAGAKRIKDYKLECSSYKPEIPTDHRVMPSRGYSNSTVIAKDQDYYEINRLVFSKENGRMRIFGFASIDPMYF